MQLLGSVARARAFACRIAFRQLVAVSKTEKAASGSDGLGLSFTGSLWALLRAGMHGGVTPLPFLAHSRTSAWGCCRTAGANRSRLLTLDARGHHHVLVHMAFRLRHSNGHGN